MKILLVGERYHPFLGGKETQLRLLAHELAKRHSVEIAASRFNSPTTPKRFWMLEDNLLLPQADDRRDNSLLVHAVAPTWLDRVRMLPLAVRGVPLASRYFFGQFRRHFYRYYRSVFLPKMLELVRGKDVVHSFSPHYLGWVAREATAAEGVPFVVSTYVHPGQYGDQPEDVAYYNQADVVFALMESDRTKLIDLGVDEGRIRLSGVVPLLPDSSDPDGFRARHGLAGVPVVLFVGRLEEYKGARALIESAEIVWNESPDTHFVLVGPPTQRSGRWLAAHRDQRIRWLGMVSEQEKADALAACDVFCMPSMYEVLPAVYLEAWSHAKPVIGGTAYGLRELIEGNEAGVVVEQEPALIAREIASLLGDEQRRLRLGQRGRALVDSRFDIDAVVGSIESAYTDVTYSIQDSSDIPRIRERNSTVRDVSSVSTPARRLEESD